VTNNTFSRILALVVLVCGSSLLSSCASTYRLDGYPSSDLRKRPFIRLRTPIGLEHYKVFRSDFYESFQKDGISDSAVSHRIDSSFYAALAENAPRARLTIDSIHVSSSLSPDSVDFTLDDKKYVFHFASAAMNSSSLYLMLSRIQYSTDLYSSIKGADCLYAEIAWALYDPRLGKIVYGGTLKQHSSTFLVLMNVITQSDWTKAARYLGQDLVESLRKLR